MKRIVYEIKRNSQYNDHPGSQTVKREKCCRLFVLEEKLEEDNVNISILLI